MARDVGREGRERGEREDEEGPNTPLADEVVIALASVGLLFLLAKVRSRGRVTGTAECVGEVQARWSSLPR